MILVTGGAGFIGSNFILGRFDAGPDPRGRQPGGLVNVDKLTYAGCPSNLAALAGEADYHFHQADVADQAAMTALLARYRPRAIVHFAAESHVDRSIAGPRGFVLTNVLGTQSLLEAALGYWRGLDGAGRDRFRFVHVSTDEVFGSLGPGDAPFDEDTPYAPNNPYSASKAGADHLVRAYHRTYGLPTLTTNCSDNYGPYQFPEKLIPLMIQRALADAPLPVYGDGEQVRDWLYVADHCRAIEAVLAGGRPGHSYAIGGETELTNIDLVRRLCALLDEARPRASGRHADLIRFVTDRPGHDRRYAIDAGRIRRELGWAPREAFDRGLARTLAWYLGHGDWVEAARRRDDRPLPDPAAAPP